MPIMVNNKTRNIIANENLGMMQRENKHHKILQTTWAKTLTMT